MMKVFDVFSNCCSTSTGVFHWPGAVGSREEGWNEHHCTSPLEPEPLCLTAFMCKRQNRNAPDL